MPGVCVRAAVAVATRSLTLRDLALIIDAGWRGRENSPSIYTAREGVPGGKRRRLALWLAAPFLIVEGMLTNGKRNSPPILSPPLLFLLLRGTTRIEMDGRILANTQIRITLASRPPQAKENGDEVGVQC